MSSGRVGSAIGFVKSGAKLPLVDRDQASGEAPAAVIRQQCGEARFVAADITKSAEVRAYVKAALDAYGAIDCFFNNAGMTASSTMPGSKAHGAHRRI
jgi:NADP-dependent 3-hydroxy acid dehydrogenase YdfG